jgi:hypothetical protein
MSSVLLDVKRPRKSEISPLRVYGSPYLCKLLVEHLSKAVFESQGHLLRLNRVDVCPGSGVLYDLPTYRLLARTRVGSANGVD